MWISATCSPELLRSQRPQMALRAKRSWCARTSTKVLKAESGQALSAPFRVPWVSRRRSKAFGQRDEPAIMGFGEALQFQMKIGRKVIQARAQELTQALISGLEQIENVKLWTSSDLKRTSAVASFQPGSLDIQRLAAALYEKDRIAGPHDWVRIEEDFGFASFLQPALRGRARFGCDSASA